MRHTGSAIEDRRVVRPREEQIAGIQSGLLSCPENQTGRKTMSRLLPLPNVTYAVGGVTIMVDGKAIGAIGVSGAPGGQFDEECARGAIAKIQGRMK
jgi:uncharacterized protein GlcG (DUF336 family)